MASGKKRKKTKAPQKDSGVKKAMGRAAVREVSRKSPAMVAGKRKHESGATNPKKTVKRAYKQTQLRK